MVKLVAIPFFLFLLLSVNHIKAQRGYYDAPYVRYEANDFLLEDGAITTPKSYAQTDLQSEASDQVCVDMTSENASVQFVFLEPADGLVLRYSVPDGDSAIIGIYHDNQKITSLTLTSRWSWEYLWMNGDPNNVGITNQNPRMRFDEVRYKLPEKLSDLKIIKESGNLWLDFIEMEPIPEAINPPEDALIFNGDGNGLQAFIDANGSKTIYLPEGIYNIPAQLYFGVPKTKLMGAGMWYTQINFTVTNQSNGGLRANARDISYSDLYITTEMTKRTNGYAGIHGVYTQGSSIKNVWIEHCATGAWIGQYVSNGPAYADGFIMTGCRFRNTYADGINLCKGTRNAIVEHCNFRNNGDDAMAIWCAEGLECINNTFRYNTVENGWRAAGAALYGGKDNKFYHLIIKDQVDVGITITNTFPGVGFNDNGIHDFHDITISNCGTFNAIYNDRVGAINIFHANSAGSRVQNIRLYNIDIENSKCDAIRIAKSSGLGIRNLGFENVTINGTGTEYPFNNANNLILKRGYAVYFDNYPVGGATYCNLNYSNLGGNSEEIAFGTGLKGSFRWEEISECENTPVNGIYLIPADTSITGGSTIQLLPVFQPENATNKIVTYSSSNPEVVSVNYDGLVTGLWKGKATISVVTQDGNFSAKSNIEVTSDPVIYYKIKNRWQNTYLYDAGDRVRYSSSANGEIYLWQIQLIDDVREIMNISTRDYMHIEDQLGYVQCTERNPGNVSSKWTLEDAGNDYYRVKSELNTSDYIHIENLQNQAQYGTIQTSWWSAMWEFEPVMIVSSVNEIKRESNATIFPNPSEGEVTVSAHKFRPNENVTILIFNLNGQIEFTKSCQVDDFGSLHLKVNIKHILSPGTYNLIATGNSHQTAAKLLISR